MIRRYCDCCGQEMSRTGRVKRELFEPGKILTVEVQVAWNRTWNDGDICTTCILLAVNTGSDVSALNGVHYRAVAESS